MRAAIYARFSSEMQREASIDDQVRNCRAYAERQKWTVPDDCVFSDEAMSGSVTGRPKYQAMQEAAKARRFDVVIVDDLSRLGRDQEEQQRLAKHLRFWEVGLVAVSDGIDTIANSKSSRFVMGIKAAMNEEALREQAERTRRGQAGHAHAGLSPGGRPYGYRSEPVYDDPPRLDCHGQPVAIGYRRVVVPEEAEVVRRIYGLYAQGSSLRRIAETLTAEGIPPPGARWRNRKKVAAETWAPSAVDGDKARGVGILNNEAYLGKIIWNKFEWRHDPDGNGARRVPRVRPESEWVVTEVPELRIVSEELWRRVKAEQARRRRQPTRRRTREGRACHLLSGLLRCGVCGASLAMRSRHGYGCATRANCGNDLCSNSGCVNRKALEAVVLEAVREELYGRDLVDDLTERVRRGLIARSKRNDGDDRTQALREAVGAKQGEIDNITASLARCQTNGRAQAVEELESRLEGLVSEKRSLEAQQAALEKRPRAKLLDLLPTLPQVIRDYMDNLRGLLDRGHVEQVKTGLAAVAEEIEVIPTRTRGERPCYLVRIKGALSQAFHLLSGRRQIFLVADAGTAETQMTSPFRWEVAIGFRMSPKPQTTSVGEPLMRKAPPQKKPSRRRVGGW